MNTPLPGPPLSTPPTMSKSVTPKKPKKKSSDERRKAAAELAAEEQRDNELTLAYEGRPLRVDSLKKNGTVQIVKFGFAHVVWKTCTASPDSSTPHFAHFTSGTPPPPRKRPKAQAAEAAPPTPPSTPKPCPRRRATSRRRRRCCCTAVPRRSSRAPPWPPHRIGRRRTIGPRRVTSAGPLGRAAPAPRQGVGVEDPTPPLTPVRGVPEPSSS